MEKIEEIAWKELEKLKSLRNTPEITIIACGSFGKRVLAVFAAQFQLKNVRTVVFDSSGGACDNIHTKVIIPQGVSKDNMVTLMEKLALEKYDILVILAALGGYTSSVLAPIVAEVGRSMGCIVVAVPIMPFSFEKERRERAQQILATIKEVADIVVVLDSEDIPKEIKFSELTNYLSRRLLTIVDNLTPSIPFVLVDRIVREIEAEIKKIGVEVPKKLEKHVVVTDKPDENSLAVTIEIQQEMLERSQNKIEEVKIISTDREGNKEFELSREIEVPKNIGQENAREVMPEENAKEGMSTEREISREMMK